MLCAPSHERSGLESGCCREKLGEVCLPHMNIPIDTRRCVRVRPSDDAHEVESAKSTDQHSNNAVTSTNPAQDLVYPVNGGKASHRRRQTLQCRPLGSTAARLAAQTAMGPLHQHLEPRQGRQEPDRSRDRDCGSRGGAGEAVQ